jgi:ABC-type uncharacterized transport system permease subunit
MSIIKFFTKETALVPLFAILMGLLIGAIIMLFGGYNPFLAYAALLDKAFGNVYNIGETIRQITPLIFTGLAVAFAFRTGLFNIGAEGQFIVGSLAATYVGIHWDLPWLIHGLVAVFIGGLAGALWGSIAGYLKAKRGVHEVITTIMLNWIALYLANYIVKEYLRDEGQQRSEIIAETASLSFPWLAQVFDNARIHLGIVIGLVMAYLFYTVLWKTKQGFELRAVGLNPHASEYAGMNVKTNIIKAMAVSGFLAGLGGAGEILGVFHYQAINAAFPGYGFQGIAVALIGGNTALGTILGAALMGILTFGATGMKFGAGVPVELINIVIALVIFFVASSAIVQWFLRRNKKKKEEAL